MGKDFEFNHIKKRMPYTTPDNFFDEMEDNVWQSVRDISIKKRHRAPYIRIITATAVAAIISLLVIVATNLYRAEYHNFNKVEQAFANLSQDDQAYLLELFKDDIFLQE